MVDQRVLIVGGTGFIGSHAASHLAALGYEVTVASRSPQDVSGPPSVAALRHLIMDYSNPNAEMQRDLQQFDSVVFTAGNDIRHVAVEDEDAAFWARVQSEGVPRFAELARSAGVGRFVQIGSFYHHLMPDLAESLSYVRARRDADERARALTTEGFSAITLNPPSIVGAIPGRVLRRFARLVSWARGEASEPELFAPTGCTNYMSVWSLSQAIAGALAHGEPGRAYLIGDENLTFQQFFQLFADAAGAGVQIEVRDQEHPFQPDRFIVQGRDRVLQFEPDPQEVALLGYDRHDVRRAVGEIVDAVDQAAL